MHDRPGLHLRDSHGDRKAGLGSHASSCLCPHIGLRSSVVRDRVVQEQICKFLSGLWMVEHLQQGWAGLALGGFGLGLGHRKISPFRVFVVVPRATPKPVLGSRAR